MHRDIRSSESSHLNASHGDKRSSLATCIVVFLVSSVAGLVAGAYVSVHVGNAWYPDDASNDFVNQTIAAVLASPIAMTIGLFPSLGFYGPLHGVLMLVGMAVTLFGSWLQFRSRRVVYGWIVFVGVFLWSHNNHLAFNAIMSV